MAAILRAAFEAYHDVAFVNAPALAMRLRSCFTSDANGPDEILEPLVSVAILALDDFDKISASSVFVADAVYKLVNARYEKRLPVCLTSNVGPTEIRRNFARFPEHGDAIVDRLREMVSVWVKMDGSSRRRAEAA
jgi:DNA replication protein DnaC